MVAFRTGSPKDEELLLPLFEPYIEKGEISNLPAYTFYAKIAAVHSQEPMSGMTVLLGDDGDRDIAKKVIALSRKVYGWRAKQKPVINKKSI